MAHSVVTIQWFNNQQTTKTDKQGFTNTNFMTKQQPKDQDQDQDSDVPRPTPRLWKTWSRDQDSSLISRTTSCGPQLWIMCRIHKGDGLVAMQQAIFTVSTTTCWDCSSTADFHQRATTCSSETTSTAANSRSRPSACCSHTRSNIPKTSSCFAATTSVPASTASTASTTNVCDWFCTGYYSISQVDRCIVYRPVIRYDTIEEINVDSKAEYTA